MARLLGLDEPVTVEVLMAAVENPTYAQNLLVTRRERRYLERLLRNPPALKAEPPSVLELARNASASLAKWAAIGFSTVDDELYAARLSACANCPMLTVPAEGRRALYAVVGAVVGAEVGERSVCARCGCVVKAKARRPGDTCPEPDPGRPGFNRWGESLYRGLASVDAKG